MENTKQTPVKGKTNVYTVVGLGLLTAIVAVLQVFASQIKFGPFSITLCLAPIVVGAALYGWKAGAWLGLVFGAVVLLTGDAALFMAINIPGTVITVLLKGAISGAVGGAVYRLIEKKNITAAAVVSGVVTPLVNTAVFLLGCVVFFLDACGEWGAGMGYDNVFGYLLFGMVGWNFLVELGVNLILSTAIVRIVQVGRKKLIAH